jgi:DNA ligase-1
MRREFLQLAETFVPTKHDIGGWVVSEKLDGTRCFWDGGLTRGMPTDQVPWASITDPKTGHRKSKIKPVASGLWSRYGNPIMAPDWFLNQLPCCPLDGELWAGRGQFQLCRSICAGDAPDERFDKIVYAVYSSPALAAIFGTGEIKNANMVAGIDYLRIEDWIKQRRKRFGRDFQYLPPGATFQDELTFLAGALDTQLSPCYMHRQIRLPGDDAAAHIQLQGTLDAVLQEGGEGIVLRNPTALWTPKRHRGILKYKPFQDAEAILTGFTAGRETDKGSRLLGKIGALVVNYNGKRLELAGLTDAEREFVNADMVANATVHPGQELKGCLAGKCFKIGQTVTFKYRELSDDGIPKEARYWRRRGVE